MSFLPSGIKNLMESPPKKGMDEDENGSNVGRGWGDNLEDLDELYGRGVKDDVMKVWR